MALTLRTFDLIQVKVGLLAVLLASPTLAQNPPAPSAPAISPVAAQRKGEKPVPFDGGFGNAVYPLSDERMCPSGATHFYSYSREFSIAGDMVFTCAFHPRNPNLLKVVVYDQSLRLTFTDAAAAVGLRSDSLRTPQFSQTRRVLFAREGTAILELDPWNRKNRVFVDFRGTQFQLPGGQTVRAGVGRDFKVGPGDVIVIELGVPRRALQPDVKDCPNCLEVLGVATFDPATRKISAYSTRGETRVAQWPKVPTPGFDEANVTQDQPARVFFTYNRRPAWTSALDFSDPVELRHASFGSYGNPKYQWSAHGHAGFFCGSNGRCYAIKPLNDIIDDNLDGVPDRVGQVGTNPNGKWRLLYQLVNTKTGKVELVWGGDNLEKQFSGGHFSRSLSKDVFFGSGTRHEGNTITRYTVSYDQNGQPSGVSGENLAYSNSEARCGYWAHPRVTGSDDGKMALFDSTLGGGCRSQVYVVVVGTPPAGSGAAARNK